MALALAPASTLAPVPLVLVLVLVLILLQLRRLHTMCYSSSYSCTMILHDPIIASHAVLRCPLCNLAHATFASLRANLLPLDGSARRAQGIGGSVGHEVVQLRSR